MFLLLQHLNDDRIIRKVCDVDDDCSRVVHFSPGVHRYFNSKLIENYFVRELAARVTSSASSPSVVINAVNPGFCQSSFFREPGSINLGLRLFMFFVQRKTHIGARNFVYAAAAGRASHGQYLSDCRVHPSPCERANLKAELEEVQKKVWDELVRKLERIEPGVTANI